MVRSIKVPMGVYRMPAICCSCGAPSGAGTIKVGSSKQKSMVSVEFPVCDECDSAHKGLKAGLAGTVILVAVFFCAWTIINVAFELFGEPSAGMCVGLLGALLVVAAVGRPVRVAVLQGRAGAEVANRALAAEKAVKVTSYSLNTFGKNWITFAFTNDVFATLFEANNP